MMELPLIRFLRLMSEIERCASCLPQLRRYHRARAAQAIRRALFELTVASTFLGTPAHHREATHAMDATDRELHEYPWEPLLNAAARSSAAQDEQQGESVAIASRSEEPKPGDAWHR